MTTYVLIIITTFVGYNKGNVTVTTQEFNSLETCKAAGNTILKSPTHGGAPLGLAHSWPLSS